MAKIPGRTVFRKGIFVILTVLLSGFAITGCGVLDTMLQKDGNAQGTLGSWIGNGGTSSQTQQVTAMSGESTSVSLFFADSTGKYLVKEERAIPKTLSLARETVNQWIKGPAVTSQGNAVQKTVSPATGLLDIGIKDGIATVDLSKEFTQPYGKIPQEITLYGLVDTLTQFPTVKGVRIRIEGKPLQRLGNLDTSNLTAKTSLVKASIPQSASTSSGNTTESAPVLGNGSSKSPASPSTINLFSFPSGNGST